MSIRLLNLQGVPDDEAEEIRALLRDNNIDFYETPRGDWVGALNGIWLHDDRHLIEAKALLQTYQQERKIKTRKEYVETQSFIEGINFLNKIKQKPILYAFYLLLFSIAILIIAVMANALMGI